VEFIQPGRVCRWLLTAPSFDGSVGKKSRARKRFSGHSKRPKRHGVETQVGKLKIPENAISAKTESVPGQGYVLVITTTDGEVRYRCGSSISSAAKIAARVGYIINSRKTNETNE
jgi:hypothetical protein